jgi:hypothetical protein
VSEGPRRPGLAAATAAAGVAGVILVLAAIGIFVPPVREATARLPLVPIALVAATLFVVARLFRAR